MPSMFERTTKKLVKEIGDQQLIPVKCLLSATKIRRFSLIQSKKARSRFWQLPDVPLDVSLMHILEPGSSVPDAAVEVSADFSDSVVRKQQAAGNVNAGAEVGFSEETTVCRESFLEYQIVSTPHETWMELQERKLPDPEPAFLKQCREAGVNLYVVTDTVELLNSPVLQDLSSANVLGKVSTPRNIWVQGEGQGGGLKVREKKLTVPKGSVLAYRRKQLVFYSREWDILHFPFGRDLETFTTRSKELSRLRRDIRHLTNGADWETFSTRSKELSRLRREIRHCACAEPQETFPAGIFHITDDVDDDDDGNTFSGGIEEPSFLRRGRHPLIKVFWPAPRSDFKLLQEEVSQKVKAAKLSKDMRGVVFSNLLAMLGDREALQDLMGKLELEPFGHLEGPGGTILTELRKASRYQRAGSTCLLLYLLEALMVLSDRQLDLLAQSMEKRILVPQRDLVRSILEPNFNCFQNIPFTLQPKLLAPLQGEGLVITYGLLKECGLKMEVNSPRSTWIPKAKEPLCALYGTLSMLTQLAEA